MTTRIREAYLTYAAWCGVIGPATIALGMLISAMAYTGIEGQAYSPLNHFVSELGEVGVAETSFTFNWGLILGGLITIPFMIYLAAKIQFWMRWLLGLLGVLMAFFAVLVGFFPMNYVAPHIFAALTFFNLGMLVAILYSLVILFSNRQPFPRWLAIPGVLYILTFSLFTFFPNAFLIDVDFEVGMRGLMENRPDVLLLAVVEWLMVLALLIWISLMGLYMITHRELHQVQ